MAYSRALIGMNMGDVEGAMQDYTETIRLKPGYANALYNRAMIRKKKAHSIPAIADLQKYLDVGGAATVTQKK